MTIHTEESKVSIEKYYFFLEEAEEMLSDYSLDSGYLFNLLKILSSNKMFFENRLGKALSGFRSRELHFKLSKKFETSFVDKKELNNVFVILFGKPPIPKRKNKLKRKNYILKKKDKPKKKCQKVYFLN